MKPRSRAITQIREIFEKPVRLVESSMIRPGIVDGLVGSAALLVDRYVTSSAIALIMRVFVGSSGNGNISGCAGMRPHLELVRSPEIAAAESAREYASLPSNISSQA